MTCHVAPASGSEVYGSPIHGLGNPAPSMIPHRPPAPGYAPALPQRSPAASRWSGSDDDHISSKATEISGLATDDARAVLTIIPAAQRDAAPSTSTQGALLPSRANGGQRSIGLIRNTHPRLFPIFLLPLAVPYLRHSSVLTSSVRCPSPNLLQFSGVCIACEASLLFVSAPCDGLRCSNLVGPEPGAAFAYFSCLAAVPFTPPFCLLAFSKRSTRCLLCVALYPPRIKHIICLEHCEEFLLSHT